MSSPQRLSVTDDDGVTVVRFAERRILDAANIEELGEDLFRLVEQDHRRKLLINFSDVEFLSSAALNKLIMLDKKIKGIGGKLVLTDLRPEIHEVFTITRLDQLFAIRETQAEGKALL